MEFLETYWPVIFCGAVVLACGITDVWRGRVYDWLTLPAIVIGLAGHAVQGGLAGSEQYIGLFGSLCGLLVCFVPFILLWRIGGIGGGDVKLITAVGSILGWRVGLDVMFASFIVAALMACVVIVRRRIARRTFSNAWDIFRTKCATSPKKKQQPEEQKAEPADNNDMAESPKLPFAAAVFVGFVGVVVLRLITAWQ